MRNAKRCETTASRDWAPPEMVIRNAKRSKRRHRRGHLVSTLFGVGRGKEVSLLSMAPGGYNHRDTSEEGEWKPPLLYASP